MTIEDRQIGPLRENQPVKKELSASKRLPATKSRFRKKDEAILIGLEGGARES